MRLVALLVGVVLGTTGARADQAACPAGEITLGAERLRAVAAAGDRGRLRGTRSTFVLPAGVAIDPATEAVTLVLEADRRAVHTTTLPPGSLVAGRRGTRFAFASRAGTPGRGSRVVLRHDGGVWRLDVDLRRIDLGAMGAPRWAKLRLAVGDDCFSAVLACTARGAARTCRPERTALLRGRVRDAARRPLAGAMLTVFDDARLESVSVFSQTDGHYVLPPLRPGTYRLRARLAGYGDDVHDAVAVTAGGVTTIDVTLGAVADDSLHLPATHFMALLLDKWPDPKIRADFTLSCGNCHQIAGWRFRRDKTEQQWRDVLTRMMSYLPPYFQETRDLLVQNVLDTFGPGATIPPRPLPAAPAGDVLRSIVYEYGLGDATSAPGCHDLELGTDGVVYADSGVRWIDPHTSERGTFPIVGGAHSIERGPDGNMWITQAGEDKLARLDVHTGQFTYYPLPRIGEDQGAYPHTLRFDAEGRIWFTLTKSNHVARFDPATETFTYYRLPTADPGEVGLSIPVAYGCDVAPDGGVWFSQLFGERIGRLDPTTGTIDAWRPPFYGPRRLHVGRDGVVWVPGYGSGVLGRFDPAIRRWKAYDLPTGLAGPPGFGTSELPYSLNANRRNGEVWVTGSNSNTLIRFVPADERFTAFPLPTLGSYTREVEFDADDNVWTCTSNEPGGPSEPGRGKFVKVELPPSGAVCGNRRREVGEECDDGNAVDCDGCSTDCRLVTGCGDGVVCGGEACDDGNGDPCDGCSATCVPETGLLCGDGVVNAACGEECDPPAPGTCSFQCGRDPVCGNGVLDPGEACDDGDLDECDACTTRCTPVTGCGDGVVCGAEACDDGNAASCDGCSPACEVEVGVACGDGIVSLACGEECDPPGPDCTYQCRQGVAGPLGTRHLSFGGASYSSALGTGVPLGTLIGAFDLVAGTPEPDGVAPLAVTGPIYYRAPILGGAFGNLCTRITSCTGFVDCNGGTAVDVETVRDSGGPGTQGNPTQVTTGLGGDGGAGAILLTCQQATIQTSPTQTDCSARSYPADETVAYTTGRTEAFYLNGDPRIGTGRIAITGTPFDCSAWTVEDGPGAIAGAFLRENDPQAGDTANVSVIDD